MKLIDACKDVLDQLSAVTDDIKHEDFCRQVTILNNSTIGQHVRHTLEFFICLKENCGTGVVNYDDRKHDQLIETDKEVALSVIKNLKNFLDSHTNNFPLQLVVNYDWNSDEVQNLDTNYFRELSYNIEHAIHHMAIIKIGLKAIAPYVQIPPHFGVAISTIKFQQSHTSDNT